MIPDGVEVTYRYSVCMFVPTHSDEEAAIEKVIVRRWETNLKPRKISCHGMCCCNFNITVLYLLES